jgi:hypothetical protein
VDIPQLDDIDFDFDNIEESNKTKDLKTQNVVCPECKHNFSI